MYTLNKTSNVSRSAPCSTGCIDMRSDVVMSLVGMPRDAHLTRISIKTNAGVIEYLHSARVFGFIPLI